MYYQADNPLNLSTTQNRSNILMKSKNKSMISYEGRTYTVQTITFPHIGANGAPNLSFKKSKAKYPKHPSKEDRRKSWFNVFPYVH